MKFDQDQPVIVGWRRLADMALLSVTWLICSLPVFTLGASCSALYHATVYGIRKNLGESAVKTFFHAFKRDFKQATLFTLPILLIAALLGGTIWLFYSHDYGIIGNAYRILSLGLLIILTMLCVWIFPLIGRFSLKSGEIIISALRLTMVNKLVSFLLTLLLYFLEALCVLYPPCVLLAMGLFAYIATIILEPRFKQVLLYQDDTEVE